MKKRIVHLTSVHPRHDIRIFRKMCRSLAANSCFEVFLVVADGKGDSCDEGVRIIDVGRESGRLRRLIFSAYKVYKTAKTLSGDVFHLHDPELLPWGRRLAKSGSEVVFDAHEDFPKQLKSKHYLSPLARSVLAFLARWYEKKALHDFSFVVTATPSIKNKFDKYCKNVEVVNNFPIIDELVDIEVTDELKRNQVCYIGGISLIRGIDVMLQASMRLRETKLLLVGEFSDQNLRESLKVSRDWSNVVEKGYLDRSGVKQVLAESFAAIVTLLPTENHVESLPNKMFEYMSAGVPIIASDFSLWREIVLGNRCGVCVDPEDPEELVKAIEYLKCNNHEARKMGENGYSAVREKFNWDSEFKTLSDIYLNLLDKS